LVTIEEGNRLVVVASKGGAPTNPDWYYNVVANPVVDVEYGTDRFQALATVTAEPERSELYEKVADNFAAFAEYKQKTSRVVPVVTLSRLL
jgi:deazaflavin-dependent oxidoreductase (nitroreductase family)